MPSPNRPNSGGADSKYFIGPLQAKFSFQFLKHLLRQLIILTLSFTCETHVYILFNISIISLKQIKRTDVWFQVSKLCFLLKSINETFWNVIFVFNSKTKRFMNIFLWIVLNVVCCFSFTIFSLEYALFLSTLEK